MNRFIHKSTTTRRLNQTTSLLTLVRYSSIYHGPYTILYMERPLLIRNWMPSSLNELTQIIFYMELTQIIFYMELTHSGSKTSN